MNNEYNAACKKLFYSVSWGYKGPVRSAGCIFDSGFDGDDAVVSVIRRKFVGSLIKHVDPLLVVSQSAELRASLEQHLKKYQREYPRVLQAESAADAALKVAEELPCCCIVDNNWSSGDGLTLLKHLYSALPEDYLPVIVIMEPGDAELAVELMQNGAQDCLMREELSPTRLYGAITNAIRACSMQRQLNHLAHFDSLTGLLNRNLLMNRLDQALKRCQRYQTRCALLYMDLDKFKPVNDTYGHAVGDQLLQAVAERIRNNCRNTDSPARLGGDEFVILLENVDDHTGQKVAGKILKAIENPFDIGGYTLQVNASVGLSIYPDTAQNASELLKQADQALRSAKAEKHVYFVNFSEKHRHQWNRQHVLETELPKAIENGELSLVYQPIVCAKTYELRRMEVLSRWPREDYAVNAFELIEMIDRLNLNDAFHEWLFHTAFAQLEAWREEQITPDICLNIPANYCYSNAISDSVGRAIYAHKIDPSKVELEITESTIMRFPDRSIGLLKKIHDWGLRIAIDDFGTGYSSMSYLTRLPLDTLKIDRNFFLTDIHKERNRKVIEAITALGHSLGLEIIAEGVETERELELAKKVGCDLLQGYYFGKPAFAGPHWDDYWQNFAHIFVPKLM